MQAGTIRGGTGRNPSHSASDVALVQGNRAVNLLLL